jgi:hypothetical protein
MLTDEKTDRVACSNVPKHMGSARERHVPVDDSRPDEFRNHLGDWLARMTEAAGVAALVPEIAPTPTRAASAKAETTKADSDVVHEGTTTADAPRATGQVVAAKI